MFTAEEYYTYESYINNLLMVMFAHEFGINVRHALRNHTGILESDYGNYYNTPALNLFQLLCEETFNATEYFDSEDESLDKLFWLNQIEDISSKKALHLFVISDELVQFNEKRTAGDTREYGATLYPVDKGIVIVYDDDYGDCDWTDIFHVLILNKQNNKANKERINHEMAV